MRLEDRRTADRRRAARRGSCRQPRLKNSRSRERSLAVHLIPFTLERFPVVRSVRLQADRGRPAEAGHYVVIGNTLARCPPLDVAGLGEGEVSLVCKNHVVDDVDAHDLSGVHHSRREDQVVWAR